MPVTAGIRQQATQHQSRVQRQRQRQCQEAEDAAESVAAAQVEAEAGAGARARDSQQTHSDHAIQKPVDDRKTADDLFTARYG